MNPINSNTKGAISSANVHPAADPELIWSIKNLSLTFGLTSWILAIASLVLVSVWTLVTGPVGLNHPNWKTNLFAWHPVMMVAVFFLSQVFAMTTWEIFPEKPNLISIVHHSIWQCAALSGLIAGLIAVFKHINDSNEPNITSMHMWLGIAAAVAYFFNFLVGLIAAIFRDLTTTEFRVIHQLIGMSAFLLTVIAIGSGIMEYQGHNGCTYEGWTFTTPDHHPAANYHLLPRGCQISNGLGITVVISALFVMYAVAFRHLMSSQEYRNPRTDTEIDPPNTTHEVDYIPAKTETVSWQQEKRSDKNATDKSTFASVVGTHGPNSDKI